MNVHLDPSRLQLPPATSFEWSQDRTGRLYIDQIRFHGGLFNLRYRPPAKSESVINRNYDLFLALGVVGTSNAETVDFLGVAPTSIPRIKKRIARELGVARTVKNKFQAAIPLAFKNEVIQIVEPIESDPILELQQNRNLVRLYGLGKDQAQISQVLHDTTSEPYTVRTISRRTTALRQELNVNDISALIFYAYGANILPANDSRPSPRP